MSDLHEHSMKNLPTCTISVQIEGYSWTQRLSTNFHAHTVRNGHWCCWAPEKRKLILQPPLRTHKEMYILTFDRPSPYIQPPGYDIHVKKGTQTPKTQTTVASVQLKLCLFPTLMM